MRIDDVEWSCGHVAGAMCAECYRLLARRAYKLAERVFELEEEIFRLKRDEEG
jgi:hypothetical protein